MDSRWLVDSTYYDLRVNRIIIHAWPSVVDIFLDVGICRFPAQSLYRFMDHFAYKRPILHDHTSSLKCYSR